MVRSLAPNHLLHLVLSPKMHGLLILVHYISVVDGSHTHVVGYENIDLLIRTWDLVMGKLLELLRNREGCTIYKMKETVKSLTLGLTLLHHKSNFSTNCDICQSAKHRHDTFPSTF
ncbi:hypothetical protein CR513_25673, partial [Mucuna pruriens]